MEAPRELQPIRRFGCAGACLYEHKEIASLLGRSGRTIRQHVVSVYRKFNLSGRAELAAFFLEDLLLPPEA